MQPLTPAQRRELVDRPFPVVRYIPPQKSWAGVSIQELDSFFHEIFRRRSPSEYDTETELPDVDWMDDEDELVEPIV